MYNYWNCKKITHNAYYLGNRNIMTLKMYGIIQTSKNIYFCRNVVLLLLQIIVLEKISVYL